ncbi:T9SS type A sorting domain-containing protein [Haliscomenobacter hydrossis]|uniref:Secretion system C-terminal sorting domain-containing protein n=1 Tax=Haliscomenobacter hydrossis (strain ATCC 27775 / DSM 1100 / LMG 10767 / O) TaxID=760192 RepID=F4L5N6_HALH1|nr:T9SS type A sorting domain-containing protein [Haliscomenobacter hydrossis]AEE51871.1 hypothetical protein Halhy_4023 [Haliscomenobacter hydrossis DSM 1100]
MKHLITLFLSLYTLIPAVAQFTYTGGPEGYNISHMAAQGDSLLAVTGNQVYLNSAKGSKQWLPFSQGLYSKDSLVRVFQAHQGRYFLAQGDKVFSRTAGSSNWQNLSKGIKTGQVPDRFVSLQDRELLLRVFDGALRQNFWYHYEGSKQEWLPIGSQVFVGASPAIAMLPNGNILAYSAGTTAQSQHRSRFEASTRQWRRIDTLNLAVFNSVVALSNTELLAGATTNGILYRSTDGGKAWSLLNTGSVPSTGRSVSLYQTGKAVYAVASAYIGRTLDGGKTWTDVNDFSLLSSFSTFVGNDSSSYVVAQGIPFFHLNSAQIDAAFSIELNPPFFCNNVLQARNNLFLYGRGGIFSFDDSKDEPEIENHTGNLPQLALLNTGLYKAGTELVGHTDFGFYRYTPAQGWRLAMDSMDLYIPYLNARGVATRMDTVVVFDGFSSYYSTNRAQKWKEVAVTPYLSTFQGFANGRKALFAAYDGGLYRWAGPKLTWEALKRPGNNLNIIGLLAKGDTLMVRTASGWFYSTDLAQQWKTMVEPASSVFYYFSSEGGAYASEFSNSFATAKFYEISPLSKTQRLLLSTPIGVRILNVASRDSFILAMPTPNQGFIYFSSNGGRTWRNLDTRSLGFVNNALFDGDKVYLGTTTGVWTMPLSRLTTGLFDPQPLSAQPLEVWPNPGADRLQIKVPGEGIEGSAQLKLYNTLGQLVHSQKVSIWNSSVELDMSQQAPGQYLILLSTPEKVWSAKWIKH